MSSIHTYVSNMIHNSLNALNTAMPARVLAYDEEENTARLQPLYKKKLLQSTEAAEITLPQLINVPILKWRFKHTHTHKYYRTNTPSGSTAAGENEPHTHAVSEYAVAEDVDEEDTLFTFQLKPSDIVLVVFSQASIDQITANEEHMPQSARTFDLTDAIVVGIIKEGEDA